MNDPGSITQLMQEGGEDAFWALYVRFVVENEQLVERIRSQLPSDRVADPIDIVSDAFHKVWEKAEQGKHREFTNRSNLMALLTCYAKAKAADVRKAKRALGESSVFGDREEGDKDLGGFPERQLAPTDVELRAAYEGIEDRLAMLDNDDHRRVALAALEGKSQAEIAESLGYSNVKRVERALAAIRKCWTEEYIEAFREAWSTGEQPGYFAYFNQFRGAGKWLLGDLVEIEIHERLKRNLAVSLSDFRSRADSDDCERIVQKKFDESLFFDELPGEAELTKLEQRLDVQLFDVVRLKVQGQTNEEIADCLQWPISSVKDALKHARQVLKTV